MCVCEHSRFSTGYFLTPALNFAEVPKAKTSKMIFFSTTQSKQAAMRQQENVASFLTVFQYNPGYSLIWSPALRVWTELKVDARKSNCIQQS